MYSYTILSVKYLVNKVFNNQMNVHLQGISLKPLHLLTHIEHTI